jgi:putative transcriptional regulator
MPLSRVSPRRQACTEGHPRPVKVSELIEPRQRTGLSHQQLASVLGESGRTLDGWQQGRRKPTGPARSLLTIAMCRPEVRGELFCSGG